MPAAAVGLAERREYGKSRRQVVHRVDQCEWCAHKQRPDPVEMLLQIGKNRVSELLPIKWTRMNVSPFGFFRGSVPVMAFDLSKLPTTGMRVQICGDAHVRNLGAFASPTGALVFDINDFDETIAGPWEWDVKRLATSIVLAGREAGNSDASCRGAALSFVAAYRRSIADCADMTVLQLARYTVHRHPEGSPVQGILQKAERATPRHILEKLTNGTGKERRFKEQPPLLKSIDAKTRSSVLAAIESYTATIAPDRRHFLEQYRPQDVAFKVVGTGSVGTRNYLILCFGNGPEDALFLQMKEEPPSAYTEYLKDAPKARNQGERVVNGQKLMQAQSDIFLGYTSMDGRDYLVRQYADFKAAINPVELKGSGLEDYARTCGEVLGKGHARSGDACALVGYCGDGDKLDSAIAKFAFAYADQTDADFKIFQKAVKSGKLKMVDGVL